MMARPAMFSGGCRRVRGSLTRALDGGPVDLDLQRHLRECARCRRHVADQRRMVRMLRLLQSSVPRPPRVDRRVRAARRIASGAGGIGIVSVAALVVRRAWRRT